MKESKHSSKICPKCRVGKLERKFLEQVFTYKDQELRYQQPGLWCDGCSDAILSNNDMDATEKILSEFRSKVDNSF